MRTKFLRQVRLSGFEIEAEQAISALTLAFATDPVIRAFYPDPRDHLTHFLEMMRVNIVPAIARHAAYYVEGFSAAAIWFPPASPDSDAEAEKERGRRVGALIEATACKEGNDDLFAALGETAYFLKQNAPDLDIVILEKEIAGFGASGRNGGACSAWWDPIYGWFKDPRTRESAVRFHQGLIDTIKRIGEITAAEGIDCHFCHEGLIMTAANEQEAQQFSKAAHVMAKNGFPAPHYELLDEAATREMIATEGACASLFTPHSAAVHPARLARGLAKAVRAKGVRLFERSPARKLEQGRVVTDRGAVRADTVLMAAEAYVSQLAGFKRQLAPIHSRMLATAPLDEARREQIGLTQRRSFAMAGDGYGQLTADGRIAFGARGTYHFGSRISNRFGPETQDTKTVWKLLLEYFPALRGVPVTHGWGGPMGFARDETPFFFLDEKRRFGWAGGHGPAGVAPSCMAGETLADLVLGLDTPRVEQPWVVDALPRVWEPEPLRWLGITGVKAWRELSPF